MWSTDWGSFSPYDSRVAFRTSLWCHFCENSRAWAVSAFLLVLCWFIYLPSFQENTALVICSMCGTRHHVLCQFPGFVFLFQVYLLYFWCFSFHVNFGINRGELMTASPGRALTIALLRASWQFSSLQKLFSSSSGKLHPVYLQIGVQSETQLGHHTDSWTLSFTPSSCLRFQSKFCSPRILQTWFPSPPSVRLPNLVCVPSPSAALWKWWWLASFSSRINQSFCFLMSIFCPVSKC